MAIVSFKTPSLTVRAASSALAAGASAVVVVDNASGDDTVARLQSQQSAKLQIVELDTNVGFGSACNIAAEMAGDVDILLFLNSDAHLTRAAADTMIGELSRLEGRAIVAPKLLDGDGRVEHSVGLLPEPGHLAVRALGLHAVGWWLMRHPIARAVLGRTKILREYGLAETATRTIDADFVSGACFAIGRAAFAELGGFDERFFMYFEDSDLCRRATRRGMRIRYIPGASVMHVRGASASGDYPFGPLRSRSMRQYLGKWYGNQGVLIALTMLWLRAVRHTLGAHPGTRRAWGAFLAAARDEDPRGAEVGR